MNSAFARLFGYEQSEQLGAHWRVLYHYEEAKRLKRRILPAVLETGYWAGETGPDDERGRTTGYRPPSHLRWRGHHRLYGDGPHRGASGLRYGRETYELLLDTIGQEGYVFFTLDHEGYITRWSNGAERLYGRNADDVLGEHLSTFLKARAAT